MHVFGRTNTWLCLLFIIYSLAIIIRSIYHPDGFLTSDSTHYLQMAHQLINGKGMSTASYVPVIETYFAVWPIGYPALIALVSVLPFISLFWAAKLVNIIFFGLCLALFKRLFKQRAPVIAMVFFISTFTEIFTYTWSEVPFIFGMIWLVYGLTRYIETKREGFAWQMMFAAILLFMMRYIGLIGAGMIGLLGFYYLYTKQWRQMITCWVAGAIPLLIAGIYLYINQLNTGSFTGMDRIPRAETVSEFVRMLVKGVIAEVNILTTSSQVYVVESWILLIIIFFVFIRPRHILGLFTMNNKQLLLPSMFLYAGIIYFIAIVSMRWSAHFDPFNFRLLGPATLMFTLSLLSIIAVTKQKDWVHWRIFLIIILSSAFVINTGYQAYASILSISPTYAETKEEITKKYAEIPPNSIIALENIHARYLRPELQYVKIHFQPYFATKESVTEFVQRLTPNTAAGIYLEVRPGQVARYNQTIIDMIEAANEEKFIKLKAE